MTQLRASAVFPREAVPASGAVLERLAASVLDAMPPGPLLYLSFAPAPAALASRFPLVVPEAPVDNFFRLQADARCRGQLLVVTAGLRGSRFAEIVFWEALHALAPGALWLDIDAEQACGASAPFGADILDRDYFKALLEDVSMQHSEGWRARLLRRRTTVQAPGASGTGWSFGLLTAGESPTAARMVRDILAVAPADSEIIVCGPMPQGVSSPRVRRIDLERPEPRGWISRKKNLIVDAAAHDNVCLLHDRFAFPPDFFAAMERYGPAFSVLTFPQFYFPEANRACLHRYADYQVAMPGPRLPAMLESRIFDPEEVLYLRYDDYAPSAFCCGGVYVAKKAVWNSVRQDESLFHCEWEDIVFGLECQRAGIPHRVNPFGWFESLTPHPLALTQLHRTRLADGSRRSLTQGSAAQARLKAQAPQAFKPVLGQPRQKYFGRVLEQLNALAGVVPVSEAEAGRCTTISAFWKLVLARVAPLAPTDRHGVAEIFKLLTRNIYNFPNCIVGGWIADHERAGAGRIGTGRMLRDVFARLRARLVPAPLEAARYRAFVDLIGYYTEVEAEFPVLFPDDVREREGAALDALALATLRREFRDGATAREAIFVPHDDALRPTVEGFT